MNIATILFTYNRSRHTKAVLDALAKTKRLPQKLFIFQDGVKAATDIDEWNSVGKIISAVTWCDTEIIIHHKNKGLANSIKDGVREVFQTYDAVIVLEDDCVPHPQFMEYMIKALMKYEKCKEVYHIGASSEPADVDGNGTDAYFLGRINSCGWGTWRDRWEKYIEDYRILGKIKNDNELNQWFQLWGQDLESHLLGNVYGNTDSWAVFWALTVILNKGFCMSPYESFIDNIGFDGTGVHSGIAENTLKIRPYEKVSEIILPEKIEMVRNYKKAFLNYYPWISPTVKNEYYKNVALDMLDVQKSKTSLSGYLKCLGIQKVMIWGKGRLCNYLIDDFGHEIVIAGIVETIPHERVYEKIPVIPWEEIPLDIPLVIVVPGYDMERIKKMVDNTELNSKLIPIDRLVKKVIS